MKIGLVTGAGSGIGRAAALRLVEDGFHVVLVGRGAERLAETKALAADPARAEAFPCDVTDPAAVEALFAHIEATHGRIDFVFNNAGVGAPAVTPDELAAEDWDRVIAVNLTGVFLVARSAFALMRRQVPQGGRIVNNGSVSAQVPRPNSIAYTAAKHAVTGITRSISLDGRPFGIACGQIDIGNAATDMVSRIATGIRQADGSIRAEATMDVRHVADAIAYMASLPLEANVQFITVMATTMPYIGRG